MTQEDILIRIEEASTIIGKTWPLYSFVTSNPLSGYENKDFKEALKSAKELLNAKIFPSASIYRQAWEQGEIEEKELLSLQKEKGMFNTPEFYLQVMEAQKNIQEKNINHDLDRIMVKWLSAFMDEGLAEWEMPGKDQGFYKAWRKLAAYDADLGINSINEIPKNSLEALMQVLSGCSNEVSSKIFTYHLAALPGWTGYINYRSDSGSLWQQAYPISLEDYLAVRLLIAQNLKLPFLPETKRSKREDIISKIQYIWLQAWENSWQNKIVNTLKKASENIKPLNSEGLSSDAQLVFCIDTRSELIRRQVESKGNYETFGYAGFFGIAMDYKNLDDGLTHKSCPPILSSAYEVSEIPQINKDEEMLAYERKNELFNFREYFLKRMKNMLPSAFGFVEGSGFYYGLSIVARTLKPGFLYRLKTKNTSSFEHICQPEINSVNTKEDNSLGIPLNEKVAIVKSAFRLTGWKQFAPLVLFVGHGSHSKNNPFASSLDCGACAANPGRHNARMLAKLANLREVREALRNEHKINIPESTFFIGAEHNTSTDEIVIFDSEVPKSHQESLSKLKSDLFNAQQTATQERLGSINSIELAHQKANNWGETRPEWGLAKNASFIVAPRELTKNENLDGRCFLHSYDWEMDPSGQALEAIMQGPMVVTQWINNHYYFSTVDNDFFGGGSKITHNVTGKFGVVQGNGGDLKMGLPLQSLSQSDNEMYHQPLRLSVIIVAPLERVSNILEQNENLKTLLDNEWIYLLVMDPLEGNNVKRYQKEGKWIAITNDALVEEYHAEKEEGLLVDAY